MLQSFRGTIDTHGIRTLRLESDEDFSRQQHYPINEFWVVLNHTDLPAIRAILASGDRARALRRVCEQAVSLGLVS